MWFHNTKEINIIRKGIEDYYKTWVKKYFQKGVKDAYVYIGADCIVIVGVEIFSFMELSIIDDAYSKQLASYSKRKIADKNYEVLKENIELIANRKIDKYYMDFDVDANTSCITFILVKEMQK